MTELTQTQRLPRMIVTGEFSAGKTKLINGLVGQQVLPSNVTSTSLPPVWLIYGKDVSFRIDLDGNVHEVAGIGEVNVHDTLVYVTAVESDTLRHMDIIDTPGNSDPNIPSACWERMVGHADMMIWCTGATQAWRQSEKSTVRDLPQALRDQGMLLITQADRIAEERQQRKAQAPRQPRRLAVPVGNPHGIADRRRSGERSARRDCFAGPMRPRDVRAIFCRLSRPRVTRRSRSRPHTSWTLWMRPKTRRSTRRALDGSILAALDRVAVAVAAENQPEAPAEPEPEARTHRRGPG